MPAPCWKVSVHSSAYRILMSAHITEKAAEMESERKYIFNVAIKANKDEVKKAITKVYGVTPQSINMINVLGKKSRSGFQNRKKVTSFLLS